MEDSFVYAQCARRKAQKKTAIDEGEAAAAKAKQASAMTRARAAQAPRVPKPSAGPRPRVKVLRKVKAATAARVPGSLEPRGDAGAPVVLPATPSVLEAPVLSSVSQVINARQLRAAEAEAAATALAEAQGVEPRSERSLLESEALDLFKTGRAAAPSIPVAPAQECPECRRQLATVVCHGSTVRACLGCKGIWMPNSVVHEVAAKCAWHQQVIVAIQTAAARASGQ